MPDVIVSALSIEGLGWLIAGTFIAGVVRGFTGFGTALVFMPIAGQFIPPVWALACLSVMDVIGTVPNLPRAYRQGRMDWVAWMMAGGVLALPLGLWLLFAVRPEVFRYAVSLIALIAPALFLVGFRMSRPLNAPILFGTGVVSGFLGGVSGLTGPPVILLYMASSLPVQVIRANIMVYLSGFSLLILVVLALQQRLDAESVVLGGLLAVPNLLGNLSGAAMFRPDRQRIYRMVGYAITAASAIAGLPLWD